MAHVHDTPARYPKTVAAHHVRKIMYWCFTVAFGAGGLVGAVLARPFTTWLVGLASLLGAVLILGTRRLDKHLDKIARERIFYWRGAKGEALVGWILQELPGDWHVFHGRMLDECRDIDHIVIGPGGVYVISTKSWRGLFSRSPKGELLYNNAACDAAREALRQAMQVKDLLTKHLNSETPFVNAVLAVPLGFVDFNGKVEHVCVLHQDDLNKTLETVPQRLSRARIQHVVTLVSRATSIPTP